MLEKWEVCCGFDWSNWMKGKPQEHILVQENSKDLLRAVRKLSQECATE